MEQSSFFEKLTCRWESNRFVCFGFDPVYDRIPKATLLYGQADTVRQEMIAPREIETFCKRLIEPTAEIVSCFKPNLAFFIRYGVHGMSALENIIHMMRDQAPEVPIILDAKWADIGKTNEGYAEYCFKYLKVDAVTVHNYLGHEAMQPFLSYGNKGVIVLCRTSNPGAGELQDLSVYHDKRKPLYEQVAQNVANRQTWNRNGNCCVVVGATYPEELLKVREIVDDMPILIPGVGAQGGSLEVAVKAGMNSRGYGHIINTSSSAMFASEGVDHVAATVQNLTEANTAIITARGHWD